jgi:hypothetical protein
MVVQLGRLSPRWKFAAHLRTRFVSLLGLFGSYHFFMPEVALLLHPKWRHPFRLSEL